MNVVKGPEWKYIHSLSDHDGDDKEPVNSLVVGGCANCPLGYMLDMASGYGCSLIGTEKPESIIREDSRFLPKTPDWCPIKNTPLEIRMV